MSLRIKTILHAFNKESVILYRKWIFMGKNVSGKETSLLRGRSEWADISEVLTKQ